MKRVLYFLLVLYLCVPHHLLELVGSDSLKAYDIPAVLIFLILLVRLHKVKLDVVYVEFALFATWYFVRAAFATRAVGVASLLYGAKFGEYLIVCLAADSLSKARLRGSLYWLGGAALVLAIGEVFGIQLTEIDWRNRFTAQFGGPYELGAVALLLALIVQHEWRLKLFGIAGIIFSGAKASLIGYFAFLGRRLHEIRWIAVIVIVALSVSLLFGDRIVEFSQSLAFFTDTDALRRLYDAVPVTTNYDQYQDQWLRREDYSTNLDVDMSTGLRLYSWVLAIKSLQPIHYLVGEGPGYFTSALDSSVLRVFVETGAIGLYLMWRFFAALMRSIGERGLAIAIIANMLFVDIFFSARFLVVLMILYRLRVPRQPAHAVA